MISWRKQVQWDFMFSLFSILVDAPLYVVNILSKMLVLANTKC